MAEFDKLGATYEHIAELPYREYLEQHSMRSAIGDVTGLRALDLGCGSGLYSRRLAGWGAVEVVGVDIAAGMLDTARAHPATPPQVRYLRRDASRPGPAPDPDLEGRFDLIVSTYVFCYATSAAELTGFFTTAQRALVPGGLLVAMTLNPDYDRTTDYYAEYGFSLSQSHEYEGAPVTIDSRLPGGHDFRVTTRWWSRDAYQAAATAAGFAGLTWTRPTVSAQGLARQGADYWAPYLTTPQALILHTRR